MNIVTIGEGVVIGITLAAGGLAYKKIHFHLDEKKICTFIRESEKPFRSTGAITLGTKLTASRIQDIAAKTKKFRKNKKPEGKESWCLI